MRTRLEALIDEMLDGNILLAEAVDEFERLYIKKALLRNQEHLSKTAKALGIHRNTISKRVADYQKAKRPLARAARGSR
ncbi:MAG TPA: helix-turn-helix domain-containing protein [Pyrinomonadaceae bacterium]|jgi:transcriptional regulator with PAS, ATPase and Fis domain|nr:helix-turn-helix domain-containing protein [Pyrinomonadaceae bacterium]